MKDEESAGLDVFGDQVSRMLRARASQHPDHADPIGITRRDLKAAKGRRQVMAGTGATLAVAGVAAVAVFSVHAASGPVKPTTATAPPTTTAHRTAPGAAQIIVTPHEWSKGVIASLITTQKWTQADFDAPIADNTIGLPAWSVDSVNHHFTVEGMLEPGQYSITTSDTPRSILARMVAPRTAFLKSIGFQAKAAALTCDHGGPCTPEQVLTVASIAESEVSDPSDGSRVAEAVYRRLQEDVPLGVDSTALYYLGHLPSGELPTERQVDDANNTYSTYAHRGLPPTPIAVGSDDMIKAALAPTAEGAYYWCATATGTEFFKKSQATAIKSACNARSSNP